jgi:hypothetical protein
MIKCYVNENLDDWDAKLPQLQFAYNSSINATTGFSPFYLATGRIPKMPLDLIHPDPHLDLNLNPGSYADNLQVSLMKAFEFIKREKVAEVNIEKINHKRKHRACPLQINDRVWLYEGNTSKDKKGKFRKKWVGPFTVIGVLNEVNYIIKQDDKKKTKTVHRNRLQKCISKVTSAALDLNTTITTPAPKRIRNKRLAITNGEKHDEIALNESYNLQTLSEEDTEESSEDDESENNNLSLDYENEIISEENDDHDLNFNNTHFINNELTILMNSQPNLNSESSSSESDKEEDETYELNYYHRNKQNEAVVVDKQNEAVVVDRPKRTVARPSKYSK